MKPTNEMTDREINHACAVEMMGWKFRQDYVDEGDWYKWDDGYWNDWFIEYTVLEWNPIENFSQCGEILDRLQVEKFAIEFFNHPDGSENWICCVWQLGGVRQLRGKGIGTKTRAICIAAIDAVRWLKEREE